MNALAYNLRSFFNNGGRASQYELARMYNVTNSHVRAEIGRLRKTGLPIAKVLYKDRINESYYHLVPDMVIARRGRPAHKFAVSV